METKKELVEFKKEGVSVNKKVDNLVVTNNEEMGVASEMLTSIRNVLKNIEAKRKSYVQPLNDQVKMINADFKTAMEPWEEMSKIVKEKIGGHVEREHKIQAEKDRKKEEKENKRLAKIAEKEGISKAKAQAKLDAEAEEKENKAIQVIVDREGITFAQAKKKFHAPDSDTSVINEKARVVTRQVVKFEVVDSNKVPDQYKVVKEDLIRKVVTGKDGLRDIPGVKIWVDTEVA